MRVASPFPSGVVLIFRAESRLSMGQEPIYLGKLMAIKLIAIDMDGTLLLPDHTISPAVKNCDCRSSHPWRECRANDGSPLCRCSQLPERAAYGTAGRLLHYL